jgi:hypothetical protein
MNICGLCINNYNKVMNAVQIMLNCVVYTHTFKNTVCDHVLEHFGLLHTTAASLSPPKKKVHEVTVDF